jgi:hypothetical protein
MIALLLGGIWSRVWGYVIAAGAVVSLLLGIYVKGRRDGEQKIEDAAEAQRLKDVAKAQVISNEVDKMSPTDLDAGLSKFMRD